MSAFADTVFMSNVPNGCSGSLNTDTLLLATFTPSQYQCNTGYYLPANTDHCVICPDVYYCSGGTFTFNEEIDQGKTLITGDISNGCKEDFTRAINNSAEITATFTPNVHNCNPGYYLPANTDGCVICPENSYCVGGTYNFDETTSHGITACAAGLHAPVGMWEPEQCGKILHLDNEVVYLRQTKKTSPALHVDMDHDGIADFFANVTTADVPMHAGSQHSLRLKYNDVIYSIYDDTVSVNE